MTATISVKENIIDVISQYFEQSICTRGILYLDAYGPMAGEVEHSFYDFETTKLHPVRESEILTHKMKLMDVGYEPYCWRLYLFDNQDIIYGILSVFRSSNRFNRLYSVRCILNPKDFSIYPFDDDVPQKTQLFGERVSEYLFFEENLTDKGVLQFHDYQTNNPMCKIVPVDKLPVIYTFLNCKLTDDQRDLVSINYLSTIKHKIIYKQLEIGKEINTADKLALSISHTHGIYTYDFTTGQMTIEGVNNYSYISYNSYTIEDKLYIIKDDIAHEFDIGHIPKTYKIHHADIQNKQLTIVCFGRNDKGYVDSVYDECVGSGNLIVYTYRHGAKRVN